MTTTPPATASPVLARLRKVKWSQYVVYIGFVLVFLFFAITQTPYFLTLTNLKNVVVQTVPITVMAIGAVFVLGAAEIDLSIGSTVALTSLVAAMTLQATGLWWLAALAAIGTGILVGAVNGLFVTVVRLPSFLVTLATMGLILGLARHISDLQSIPVTNSVFVKVFGGGTLLGVPTSIWWTVVAVGVGWHVLRQRRFGAHVLAVGDDASAAEVSGIKVERIKLMVFVVSSLSATIAGLLYAGRLQGARYSLGETDMMSVLAAAIVGGTSMSGGRATVIGALVGSLMMSMINNGLIIAGLSVSQQMIVRGIIILIAVSLSLRSKKSV